MQECFPFTNDLNISFRFKNVVERDIIKPIEQSASKLHSHVNCLHSFRNWNINQNDLATISDKSKISLRKINFKLM